MRNKFNQWLGDRLSRKNLSLDLKAYYQAPLLNFIFCYNEEPAALFCFSHDVECFLWFCCISSKEIRKEILDRWWSWLWVVIHMQAPSRITFVPYALAFTFPLEMVLSAGTNKISKYVIFPPPMVILNAPLQGVNGRSVSNLVSHLHKCEASLSCWGQVS